jgi:hypothetical protein
MGGTRRGGSWRTAGHSGLRCESTESLKLGTISAEINFIRETISRSGPGGPDAAINSTADVKPSANIPMCKPGPRAENCARMLSRIIIKIS